MKQRRGGFCRIYYTATFVNHKHCLNRASPSEVEFNFSLPLNFENDIDKKITADIF